MSYLNQRPETYPLFVAEATRMVEAQRGGGFGLDDGGKFRVGAPVRVNPSRVLEGVRESLNECRGAKRATFACNHRDVEEALRAAGWSEDYLGTKRFFSPPGEPKLVATRERARADLRAIEVVALGQQETSGCVAPRVVRAVRAARKALRLAESLPEPGDVVRIRKFDRSAGRVFFARVTWAEDRGTGRRYFGWEPVAAPAGNYGLRPVDCGLFGAEMVERKPKPFSPIVTVVARAEVLS